ncbi:MAG: ComEC/Rec2 family competence protein [Cyanobacteria bacterium P01_A01_bin.17]
MLPFSGVVLCLAFILGLLTTGMAWGWLVLVVVGLIGALLRSQATRVKWLPFAWRLGPPAWLWFVALGVALAATGYLHLRVPYPSALDISRAVPQLTSATRLEATVVGTVKTFPGVTRSQKAQFQLQASQVIVESESTRVRSKVYVTVTRKQAQEIYPSQTVEVSGFLYQPPKASIPKGFDFSQKLARQGIFVGLSGQTIKITDAGSTWGWWALRQRIVRSQARYLGETEGSLVSAMVLGGRSVDMPCKTQDDFRQAGLAHALAASGFHVSLILAAVLAITRSLPVNQQAAIGGGTLVIFGFLSGFTPSVSRAILMGIASLSALVTNRRKQSVGFLLLIAILLLLINPLWIWDLGFQLSFLATFGLIISIPTFIGVLDWLPPRLATLIAVPLAATLWTLPLQLFRFGVVPVYGLLANILATGFLIILTVGGFISGLAAALLPPLGSALAGPLYYPAHILTLMTDIVVQLPGSTTALGTVSILQLVVLYGLLLGAWLWPWGQRHWQWALAAALVVIVLPVWQVQSNRFQVTLFDSVNPPIMVIQQPGATLLVNSGDYVTVQQSVIPFLWRQGVNGVEVAIATSTWSRLEEGWQTLLQRIPVNTFIAGAGRNSSTMTDLLSASNPRVPTEMRVLQAKQPLTLGQVEATFLRNQPAIVLMKIGQKNWLLVTGGDQSNPQAWLRTAQLPNIDVLWWVGKPGALPEMLKPETIIYSSRDRTLPTANSLKTPATKVYWTVRDGAIQWTPENGFRTTLSPGDQTAEIF